MTKPITKILIVGGGTAGWMAAATLSRYLTGKHVQIRLVESDAIGTVGVGEATVPGIAQLHHYLGINELDFLKATNATFKLGIQFRDWKAKNHHFFHPFAGYGVPIQEQDFYLCWLKARADGYNASLEEFCLCTQLAMEGRFVQPDKDAKTTLAWFNYAYHFDASLYAKFLRRYAEANGVERIEGKVDQVRVRESDGFLESITMESGQLLDAELFIDCTGFSALLIEKTLKTGYTNWSQWLPCNSAIAVQSENAEEPAPYTQSTARDAGWQWKIPLQHRAGNGYVYCDKYLADEQATDFLLQNLSGKCITSPKVIKFVTGMRNKFWNKNCVALGLASGFLEPLESTSISLIQTGIAKLLQCWPDASFDPALIAEANRLNELEYTQIRDFIILHYCSTQRDDTPFWSYVRNMPLPLTLQNKIETFKSSAQIMLFEQETFEAPSWLSIYNGFGIVPASFPTAVASMDSQYLSGVMEQMRRGIRSAIPHAPTQAQFLAQM